MQIELTAEQRNSSAAPSKTGRVKRTEEAVQQALVLWIERERARDEILAAIDEAEASFPSGEGIIITRASMQELAEDVKRRGRARLAAEKSTALMPHRLAPRARTDLDEIWHYVALESGSEATADPSSI
jgi:hypothetical protein